MKNKYYFLSVLGLASLATCADTAKISIASDNIIDTQLGEVLIPDEVNINGQIEKNILDGLKEDYKKPLALRDVHAKQHGTVKAVFKIHNEQLPTELRVGIFAQNKEYQSYIRFSNGAAHNQPDKKGDVRGMAIKLMGVPGKKLLPDESDEQTQDFLMINNSTFFMSNMKDYVPLTSAVRKGGLSLAGFAITHPKVVYNIYNIFKKKVTNPVEVDYFSSTPYKLGSTSIKFRAKPCNDIQTAMPDNPGNDFLREAMTNSLSKNDICYNFMVQLHKGSMEEMPVEDPTVEWDTLKSPYITVATIIIPKQKFDTPQQLAFGENLSFTPWHALPEHKPLGAVNRMRKSIYETISKYRHNFNNVERKEPSGF